MWQQNLCPNILIDYTTLVNSMNEVSVNFATLNQTQGGLLEKYPNQLIQLERKICEISTYITIYFSIYTIFTKQNIIFLIEN